MKSYKQFTEGTIQPNGTDKIDPAAGEIATKKKTEKEMEDQQNESYTFDTAAMAKQELADAKNRKHRKRGKVANLLRKLGMKEETVVESALGTALDKALSKQPKLSPVQVQRNKDRWAKRQTERQAANAKVNEETISENTVTTRDGDKVKAGDAIGYKDGYEQYGTVHKVEGDHVHVKSYDSNTGEHYVHRKHKSEIWKEETQVDEAYGRHDAYTRDYHSSISGMGKRQSAAYHADGGANDEGWGDEHHSSYRSKPAAHPDEHSSHAVHINGKKWKSFATRSHASNVAKKIKGATIHKEETMAPIKPKSLREFVETIHEAKPVNVDKVNAAGETPHEEKWEAAKKTVKKEAYSVDQLLQALKEGMWPGTPEYKAKFDNQAKQGGGSGVKKGSRYGGSLQKPDNDNDADDKPADKKNK